MNQAYAEIFGYATPDDVYRLETAVVLIAPHERDRLLRYRDDRLAGKEAPTHYEYQGVRKDGSLVWLEMQVRVIPWDSTPALQSTVMDITERKQAEDALRESETRFRQIAENIHEVFWMSDPRIPQILYISPAYEGIWGRSCQSLYASPTSWIDAIHPEDRVRGITAFEQQCHGERTEVEYRIVHLDGSVRWIRDRGFPIHDHTGQVYRITGIAEDITEQKRGEEERLRLADHLRQSQKMEAIGTLAGGIAHEFNNILAAILGFTELTQREVPQGSVAWQNLHEVLTAGRRAKDLVQQILTFSRHDGQERHPVDFSVLTKDVLRLLRASLPSTIAIHEEVESTVGLVLTNATHVHQILMNLCTNAEYAMRETGGTLTIGVDTVEVDDTGAASHPPLQPGPYIRVTVCDTGPGIPPDMLEHIFEPFFTTKGVGEGTGMGLAIVHGIVTSHDGAITIESTPGEGTTCTVYLPRIGATAVDEPPPRTEGTPHGKGCLLFVDDEDMLVRVGQAMLEHLGYDVVARTSSTDALDIFQATPHRFDLVITDQTMPQLTGEALAQELRHIRPDIPIILCTGFSHVMNAAKAQALGIDAFCMKPLATRDLAVTIQRVLARRART